MKASDTAAYLDIHLAVKKAALKEAIADASLVARKAVRLDALLVECSVGGWAGLSEPERDGNTVVMTDNEMAEKKAFEMDSESVACLGTETVEMMVA
eukprot:gene25121-biopygen21225